MALDNISHKVSQGYEWIKGLPNIRLASDADEIPDLARKVFESGPRTYDRTLLDPYYERMKMVVLDAIK